MRTLQNKQSEARILRRNGMSVPRIAERLGVAKSSVSIWVSDVKLSPAQERALRLNSKNAGREAFARAAQTRSRLHKDKVAKETGRGVADTYKLSTRDIHMLGLGLYWGEGYKKGSAELAFTNSDPLAAQFFITWLEQVFNAKRTDLVCRVSVNALHKNREKEILDFWCRKLKLTREQFTKTSFVNVLQNRNYAGRGIHYGTLRIKLRGGAPLRARILSSISTVSVATK